MTTKEEYANEKKDLLRKNIKKGDRIFFVERHKTPRACWLDVFVFYSDPLVDGGSMRSWRITGLIGAVCNIVYDEEREALKVVDCGFGSDYAVRCELAEVLFGDYAALKYETLR